MATAKKPATAPKAKPAPKAAVARKTAAPRPASAKAKAVPAKAKAVAKKPAAVPASKPVRKPAPKPAPAPAPVPTEAFLTAGELNSLRLHELKGALRSELEETRTALDGVLARLRQEIDRELSELEGVVARLDGEQSAAPEVLELTGIVEKLADRLSKFRSEQNPSLEDAAKLLRRLGKTAKKLRR